MHIKYNLTLYYPNGFFNITRFKTADSFIESSNTISSISTNSNMFRQIVGEIIALWRKNLFVLRKCFEEITARQYRRIDKGKLLEEIMKNLWIGY